jgi:hypothetical protein
VWVHVGDLDLVFGMLADKLRSDSAAALLAASRTNAVRGRRPPTGSAVIDSKQAFSLEGNEWQQRGLKETLTYACLTAAISEKSADSTKGTCSLTIGISASC